MPALLRSAARARLEGDVDLEHAVLLPLAHHDHRRPTRPGMARWRKKLFLAIARNAANPVEYFHLPDDRTVVMGSHIEL